MVFVCCVSVVFECCCGFRLFISDACVLSCFSGCGWLIEFGVESFDEGCLLLVALAHMVINLSDIRKEFECPICLGIIRKTRTVMECLHRFCRKCIDKAMRLGKNECPACRKHCASRRSLRDDPNFDAMIAILFPDIDKYEEEELAWHEDEMIHNKQIQDSIAQTLQRQTEASGRKRRARAGTSHSRRRRIFENAGELQVSNDNVDMNDNDVGKDLSSGDEKTETGDEKSETGPKEGGEQETQFPQESATIGADGTGDEKMETGDENTETGPKEEITSSGTLAVGKNGHQSNTPVNGQNARSSRLSRLIDHLRNSDVKDDELEIHLLLVSLDEQRIPRLQEPYLCCRPTLSVKLLCQYVAVKAEVLADEVELCLVEEPQVNIIRGEGTVDPNKDKLRVLGDEETLAELYTRNVTSCAHLILAYKVK
ncbi:putative E3 ubiquitin-protein ligase RING1a [Spatholobus suberectus]|nr:putative E3 ubiquitin-protein ligase RING1a [Spatholobus suberectus]